MANIARCCGFLHMPTVSHVKNSSANLTKMCSRSVHSTINLIKNRTMQWCLCNNYSSLTCNQYSLRCINCHRHRNCRNAPSNYSIFERCLSSKKETVMNVFDRNAKRLQRNRTALMENYEVYDYIKEEMGYRVADRICDVKRKFDVAVDLGCGRGHVSQHIYSDMVGVLFQTDMAELVLKQSKPSPEVPTYRVHADEEFIPFPPNSLDLVVSSLSLHWVNDLPGSLRQIHQSLKNDGCFIGAMFGGDTLFELRVALQLAETEREGGIAAHVSPFASAQDLGGLLNRSGFVMLTIDIDEIVINYPSMFELMQDLKGMGENNCSWSRRPMIPKATQEAAAAIYKKMYGDPDKDSVPATFQILNFIGWKPDPSQKPAAKRGSGQVSLQDLDKLDQLSKQIEDMKASQPETPAATTSSSGSGSPPDWGRGIDQLTQDIEKLRRRVAEEADPSDDGAGDKK